MRNRCCGNALGIVKISAQMLTKIVLHYRNGRFDTH